MGAMKKWATAQMFGQDAINRALYGSIYKPKPVKEPKPAKTPKPKKKAISNDKTP